MSAFRLRVSVPARLLPYLRDMLRGGLSGRDLRAVVIGCVERQVEQAIGKGAIPLRIKGKICRRQPQ